MRRLVALSLTVALAAPATALTAAAGEPAARTAPTVTVMTQNIYLGVDVTRPLAAAQQAIEEGKDFEGIVQAVANENAEVWETLLQTDFETRSRLLAEQISAEKPDLIGLQEVALYRVDENMTFPPNLNPEATEVEFDFLAMLRSALADAGTPYTVVRKQREADVEAPAFEGTRQPEPVEGQRDIRVTIFDVILKRKGAPLEVLRTGGDNYDTNLPIKIGPLTQSFNRGYAWADVRRGDTRFRFITTHFEAFGSDIALAQAKELLAGPADRRGNVILVGDINSDPLDPTKSKALDSTEGDGVRHWAPYYRIVKAGFTDQWLRWAQPEEGWTSGLSETVDDPDNSGFDHRIDMIFGRWTLGSRQGGYRVLDGAVTGTSPEDKDPGSGLWPSDHGGVALKLRLR